MFVVSVPLIPVSGILNPAVLPTTGNNVTVHTQNQEGVPIFVEAGGYGSTDLTYHLASRFFVEVQSYAAAVIVDSAPMAFE
jgi:hypothetical protein